MSNTDCLLGVTCLIRQYVLSFHNCYAYVEFTMPHRLALFGFICFSCRSNWLTTLAGTRSRVLASLRSSTWGLLPLVRELMIMNEAYTYFAMLNFR
jgi:hypothetical protein